MFRLSVDELLNALLTAMIPNKNELINFDFCLSMNSTVQDVSCWFVDDVTNS